MSTLLTNRPEWYEASASKFKGEWLPVKNYPKDMPPLQNEVGAVIKLRHDGFDVIFRIKQIC